MEELLSCGIWAWNTLPTWFPWVIGAEFAARAVAAIAKEMRGEYIFGRCSRECMKKESRRRDRSRRQDA